MTRSPHYILMKRFHCRRCMATLAFILIAALSSGGKDCPAMSTTQQPEQIVKRLEEKYSRIESLSFSFLQQTSGQLAGRPKEGQGNGIFAKTGSATMMRWNYLSPDHQIITSDGTSVSMYFEKLNQMIISPVDSVQTDVLFSFFTGDKPIGDNFAILPPEEDVASQSTPPGEELQVVKLRPLQSQSQINTIHVWITTDSLIRRIEFLDHFDTRTIIDISDIRINPIDVTDRDLLAPIFTFTPPEGTEIIRQ